MSNQERTKVDVSEELRQVHEILMLLPPEEYIRARLSLCPEMFFRLISQGQEALISMFYEQLLLREYYEWHANRLGLNAAKAASSAKRQ